jgi:hypothetical protein
MQKIRFTERNSLFAGLRRKGKKSYLQKNAAERGNSLSAEKCRKALYIGNVSVTADASVCRIGLESLPYPKQRCINVSPCLSAKIRKLKNAEVRL